MRRSTLTKAAAVAGACAVVGAGAGIVGSAAAPSNKSKSDAMHFGPRRGFMIHGGPGFGIGGPPVHSQAVVPNKAGNGFVTATEDNGTVKSVSGNDVTISEGTKSVHYKDVTLTIPSGATIYRNGSKAALGDLKQGDEVHVTSSSEGTFVMADDSQHEMGHGWRGGPPPGGPRPGGPRPGGPPGPYGMP